jgi:hypothetical protein
MLLYYLSHLLVIAFFFVYAMVQRNNSGTRRLLINGYLIGTNYSSLTNRFNTIHSLIRTSGKIFQPRIGDRGSWQTEWCIRSFQRGFPKYAFMFICDDLDERVVDAVALHLCAHERGNATQKAVYSRHFAVPRDEGRGRGAVNAGTFRRAIKVCIGISPKNSEKEQDRGLTLHALCYGHVVPPGKADCFVGHHGVHRRIRGDN